MEQRDTNRPARLEWMERLFNTMSGIVYLYNVVEQRNVYANRNVGVLLGYTQEKLQEMGSSILATIMHPDDLARLPERIGRIAAAADGEVVKNEYRLHSAAGEWIWFQDHSTVFLRDAQGNMVEFVGVLQDITEHKRQEQALHITQFTMDRSPDSIIWLTPDDGSLRYVNDAACTILGYTREELLSMQIPNIDPFITEEQFQHIGQMTNKQGMFQFESIHRHKDGHDIPVEIVVTSIAFEGQEYACTFARDITERKRAEEERTALQQRIIVAQRNTLRELSTPLIPITNEVVIMPLIGTIDSQRAQQIMEALLDGVAQQRATLAILDITGVQIVDTQVADALIRAAQAVRLLGAQVMLTGIQPQIAQTLVQQGIDLSGIITHGSLQTGIAAALRERNKT